MLYVVCRLMYEFNDIKKEYNLPQGGKKLCTEVIYIVLQTSVRLF